MMVLGALKPARWARYQFPIHDHQFCIRVVQDVSDGLGFQPGVERVQHSACQRQREMQFERFRDIRAQHRDRIALLHAKPHKARCHSANAGGCFGPAAPDVAVDLRRARAVQNFGAAQERQRWQGHMVRPCLLQSLEVMTHPGSA